MHSLLQVNLSIAINVFEVRQSSVKTDTRRKKYFVKNQHQVHRYGLTVPQRKLSNTLGLQSFEFKFLFLRVT